MTFKCSKQSIVILKALLTLEFKKINIKVFDSFGIFSVNHKMSYFVYLQSQFEIVCYNFLNLFGHQIRLILKIILKKVFSIFFVLMVLYFYLSNLLSKDCSDIVGERFPPRLISNYCLVNEKYFNWICLSKVSLDRFRKSIQVYFYDFLAVKCCDYLIVKSHYVFREVYELNYSFGVFSIINFNQRSHFKESNFLQK